MKWYRIESSRILEHNGRRYEGGQIVKLDDIAAQPLLDLGAIFECDPPEAEAELEHKPEVEAGAKRGRKREIEAKLEAKAATRRRGRPRR